MLRNYIKIALRSLWKNKLFSFVTIFGLALSMAVSVALLMQLKMHYDTDHFHPYLNRTFRLLTHETTTDKTSLWASVPVPLVSALQNVSFIKKTVRVQQQGYRNLQTDKGDVAVEITYTEPAFFEVFGFKLLSGNAQNALKSPNSVLLAEKTAQRIFGNKNPLGQTIILEDVGTFTVAGLIQTPPLATHLPVEVMLSLSVLESLAKKGTIANTSQDWKEYKNTAVYALLDTEKHAQLLNQTLSKLNRKFDKTTLQFSAQPIEDITPWNPAILKDMHAGTNWKGIWTSLFLVMALTVLAAFNYTSLSLARALARSREVGIRKASGAVRGQIIGQFLAEAIIIALFSLALAFPLTETLYTFIPDAQIRYDIDPYLVLVLLAYIVLTGLIAGAVPAWILSAFQPVQVLRKMQNISLIKGVSIYKFLIVIQFAVTTMIMIFIIVLRDASNNTSTKLSIKVPKDVLVIDLKKQPYQTLQLQIEQLSQVESVSATNWLPMFFSTTDCKLQIANKTHQIQYINIDPTMVQIANIQLLAGHNFSKIDAMSKIERYILVNESAAKLIAKKPVDAVNKYVAIDSSNIQIIGVVSNESIPELMPEPCIVRYLPNDFSRLAIKIKPNSAATVTTACQKIWHNNVSQKTLHLYDYRTHLKSSSNFNSILYFFGFFCAIVMVIACLGILGVAAYSVEVRTKEVGIRKALGANNGQLVWTISKDFGKLLLYSGVVGIPAGWFCGTLLRNRMGDAVDLRPYNLLIGFGLVLAVGLITVLSQTLRAGQINPAEVLKMD